MPWPPFPPNFYDWKPAKPPSPPLPKWLAHELGLNPWLSSEQMSELESEFGSWAAHRAEAMVGPIQGFQMVRRAAYSMSTGFLSRLPTIPKVAVKKPKERKPKEPTIAEELGKAQELGKVKLPVLTPAIEEELISALIEAWEIARHTPRTTNEQIKAGQMVIDWAEEKDIEISGGKATEIVNKALARGITVKA